MSMLDALLLEEEIDENYEPTEEGKTKKSLLSFILSPKKLLNMPNSWE